MKILIFIILFIFPACTTVSVTQSDGTVWSYSSAKDLENVTFDFRKSKDRLSVKVKVSKVKTKIAGEIAKGLASDMAKGVLP